MMRFLLANNANIVQPIGDGDCTHLHMAVEYGTDEVVQYLLEAYMNEVPVITDVLDKSINYYNIH